MFRDQGYLRERAFQTIGETQGVRDVPIYANSAQMRIAEEKTCRVDVDVARRAVRHVAAADSKPGNKLIMISSICIVTQQIARASYLSFVPLLFFCLGLRGYGDSATQTPQRHRQTAGRRRQTPDSSWQRTSSDGGQPTLRSTTTPLDRRVAK